MTDGDLHDADLPEEALSVTEVLSSENDLRCGGTPLVSEVTRVLAVPHRDATPEWVAPPSNRPPGHPGDPVALPRPPRLPSSFPPPAPQFGPRPVVAPMVSRPPRSSQPILPSPVPNGPPSPPPRLSATALGFGVGGNAAATASNEAADPSCSRPPFSTAAPSRLIELLWFDSERAASIKQRFGHQSSKSERPVTIAFSEKAPEPARTGPEGREAVALALANEESTPPEALRHLVADELGEDGTFKPPIVLLVGTLELGLDEGEVLRALVSAARPFGAANKVLQASIASIDQMLQTPGLEGPSLRALARVTSERLLADFASANRGLPKNYLGEAATRTVLEQRGYQRRVVFGENVLRAELSDDHKRRPLPAYLPEVLAQRLPLFQRMSVAVIAEVHVAQDQYESHPHAIRILALGRALSGVHGA